MQNLLNDALSLAVIGQQLASDYGRNVAEARRLLDSFFEVEKPPMTTTQLSDISS